jgi:hypothetical protein
VIEDDTGVHYLVIVSRERPELLAELERRFAEDKTVTVIVDRRVDERRQLEARTVAERRRGDRRSPAMQVSASLWLAGYVVVRVS